MSISLEKIDNIVEVRNLTKRIFKKGKRETILNNISFHIKQKEILGVIGFSGAGKTTLLKCISGLKNFDSGEVILNKDQLHDFKTRALIFQHFSLFTSKTALENVAFPLVLKKKQSSKLIKETSKYYLNLVGMSHKEDAYPGTLSGGEKQRVAIARALSCESKLIFCDEATSALDRITRKEIINLLFRLNQKLDLSCLFVTHDIEIMKRLCNRTLVMDKGSIVEEGNTEDLLLCARHEITKKLLSSKDDDSSLCHSLNDDFEEIVRLSFNQDTELWPIVTSLSRETAIDVHILRGEVDVLQTKTLVFLTISIKGSHEERTKVKNILRKENIRVHDYAGKD